MQAMAAARRNRGDGDLEHEGQHGNRQAAQAQIREPAQVTAAQGDGEQAQAGEDDQDHAACPTAGMGSRPARRSLAFVCASVPVS